MTFGKAVKYSASQLPACKMEMLSLILQNIPCFVKFLKLPNGNTLIISGEVSFTQENTFKT